MPSFRVGIEGESGWWRAAGACKQGREVRLVEGRIRWAFRLLPKVRCLAAILHSGFPSCWMAHKQRSIVYLLVIGRGLFKKFEIISMVFGIAAGIWKPRHIECSENREAAFAKRASDWSLGPCSHKNSWRFLPEFRGRSCDARLFCNRRLIIYRILDGPIKGIADYKTTRIRPWGGGYNFVLNCLK